MGERILGKQKGVYQDNLKRGQNCDWVKDIERDVNRTFPHHRYFSNTEGGSGEIGQKALGNVLTAYAVYNPEVGYCQGMNFMAGFLLIVSGSREKESFCLLTALLSQS